MAIRSVRAVSRVAVPFGCVVSALLASTLARSAGAAPLKVACIGEQTTVSCEVALSKEWPAQLQTILGANYDVVNDGGDTQGTVLTQASYCKGVGADPFANPANACTATPGGASCPSGCYKDSITSPDVVVIGPWGEHDYRVVTACQGTNPAVASLATFEAAYDALVEDYLALTPKPLVILTTPLLIPSFDTGTQGFVTTVIEPAVKAAAAKYNLPYADLYTTFMPTSATGKYFTGQGDGQVNAAGETEIATLVATLIQDQDAGAGEVDAAADTGTGAGSGAASGSSGTGSSGTAQSGTSTSGVSASGNTSASGSMATSGTAGTSGTVTSGSSTSGTVNTGTSGTAPSETGSSTSGSSAAGTGNGGSSGTETNNAAPKSSSGCALSSPARATSGGVFALLVLGCLAIVRRRRSV
jgi:hypothetical protein